MKPFPWKKVKSTRLSQLVSDQIHQRRTSKAGGRSSALVVETGFPTSLVDLLVKNKDKLKRPWRRNKKHCKTSSPLSSLEYDDDDDDDDDDSCFMSQSSRCPPPPPSPVDSSPLHSSARASDNGVLVNGNGGDVDHGDANRVLRLFLVMVGITVSAFLLFFLDYMGKHNTGKAAYIYLFCQTLLFIGALYTVYDFYVGKHAGKLLTACTELKEKLKLMVLNLMDDFSCHSLLFTGALCTRYYKFYLEKHARRLLRLCAEVKEKLRLMIIKIMEIFGIRKCHQEAKIEILENLSLRGSSALKDNQDEGMSNYVRVIPIVQQKCSVKEIECEKWRIDDKTSTINFGEEKGRLEMDSKKMVVEEEGNGCGNGELKRRKSFRAKIKLTMKELVLKRLSKKGRDLEIEGSPVGMDNAATSEEECEDPRERRCNSKRTSLSREFDNGDGDGDMEETLNQEKGKTGSTQNSGYVLMLLTALIGLIEGRVVALVLTLTWCLIWKLSKTLREYIKWPAFLRTSVVKCS